jgi:hypothetical protein
VQFFLSPQSDPKVLLNYGLVAYPPLDQIVPKSQDQILALGSTQTYPL